MITGFEPYSKDHFSCLFQSYFCHGSKK